MPVYDFINTKTGKKFTDMMSIADKEEYLKKNPHIKQGIGKINIVSGVMGMGRMKTDGGWKDMLSRIGDAHPGSKVHDLYGNDCPAMLMGHIQYEAKNLPTVPISS